MKIKCEVIKLDVPTINGRVYSKKAFQKSTDEYNKQKHKFGTIHGLPSDDISNISHEVLCLNIDGNAISADVEILNSPKGNILQDMLNTGKVEFEMNLTAMGSMSEGKVANMTICSMDIIPRVIS